MRCFFVNNINNSLLITEDRVIDLINHAIKFNNSETFFYHNLDFTKVIYVSSAYEKILGGSK